ncbi:MAG: ATP-binding protein [Candidatus Omnitrophota bacterium]
MDKEKQYPLSKVSHSDTKIEVSCRSVNPALLYFEEKYGHQKLNEFISDTKMNLSYLEDKQNWVSYEYWCRLLEKLIEYTDNPNAPFIAGTYSAKKKSYGSLETFYSRLGTPAATYKLLAEFSVRYNKIIDKWNVKDLKRNSCTIVLRYFDNYKQNRNNCLNVQGGLASIPNLFNLPLAKIKHPRCAAEGADSCVYEISWVNRPLHLFGLLGLLAGIALVYFIGAEWNIFVTTGVLMLGYLIGRIKDHKSSLKDSASVNERESKDLMESIETIEKMNVELQGKVEQRTKELQDALEELKRSQSQLIQSEKMASVGRLAAGMAHELNNPVGAIRNYIQDMLEDIPSKNPLWERLKNTEKATSRCRRIVADLLTFARESKEMNLADVNNMVEIVILNAKEEISNPDIEISKELSPKLPKVSVDVVQIQQVFMNIIMNAAGAIKDKGRIAIKTGSVSGNIIIEISDTGEGIPVEIQDKIFDPFVTTKAPGKGMGLGLAISYNIIKRFNGDIKVVSEKGKGTIFTVTLPLTNKTTSNV